MRRCPVRVRLCPSSRFPRCPVILRKIPNTTRTGATETQAAHRSDSPSWCRQAVASSFWSELSVFWGKFLKRCGAISLARTQRRCRMVEGRGGFWRRPWRQVRNFTFGFLTRIKFKIVTHELSSVDLDFRHVPHERIGIIRDKCRFIGSKATRRGRGALKEEPDPNGAQA